MAILKSKIKNQYSQIPNSVIRVKDISDGDYRLLMYLYSLPDDWKISQGYLGNELNCNRRNINAKLKRLKESGYLEITRSQDDDGSDYIYTLKEREDVSVNNVSSSDYTSSSDVSVNNVSSSDVSVNDTLTNTNITNTDVTNIDYNKEEIYKEVIDYLNMKIGSNYKHTTKSTQTKINARLNEGYNLDDFIAVIDKKSKEWLGTNMEQYLRPETLFGAKFESYLNQKEVKKELSNSDKQWEILQGVYDGTITIN